MSSRSIARIMSQNAGSVVRQKFTITPVTFSRFRFNHGLALRISSSNRVRCCPVATFKQQIARRGAYPAIKRMGVSRSPVRTITRRIRFNLPVDVLYRFNRRLEQFPECIGKWFGRVLNKISFTGLPRNRVSSVFSSRRRLAHCQREDSIFKNSLHPTQRRRASRQNLWALSTLFAVAIQSCIS